MVFITIIVILTASSPVSAEYGFRDYSGYHHYSFRAGTYYNYPPPWVHDRPPWWYHRHRPSRYNLPWNKPAIDFYLDMGAVALNDWTTFRLSGKSLKNFNNNS